MTLLKLLKSEAVSRGLLEASTELDAPTVFCLVRDMPYRRAPDRQPETILREWQGTCSGKHYLLQALLAELGISSQVMACTSVAPVDANQVPAEYFSLYEAANRRFVDVHNYLLVDVPDGGQMVVDATWPLSARKAGMRANEAFVLGQDQEIACEPLQTWPIPPNEDPQAFKNELLAAHFTPAELEFRDLVIQALGDKTSS